MPVVSVRIDAHSSYTIELEDEYSFPEFVKTIEKHVHVLNRIAAGRTGPAQQETPEAQDDLEVSVPPETGPEEHCKTEKGGGKMGNRRLLPAVLVVLLLLIGGGFLFRLLYNGNSEAGKGAAEIAENAASNVQKYPIAGPADSPGHTQPAPLPVLNKLLIEARETAWIKAAEDYNPAYRVVLRPGERLEREATRFVLQIGNIKGVDITFNDEKISFSSAGAKSMGKAISLTLPGPGFSSAGKQKRQ